MQGFVYLLTSYCPELWHHVPVVCVAAGYFNQLLANTDNIFKNCSNYNHINCWIFLQNIEIHDIHYV